MPAAHRRAKQPVQESDKDLLYWQRRAKNNESARRSREHRRQVELDVRKRLVLAEEENSCLRQELEALKRRFGLQAAQLVPCDKQMQPHENVHGIATPTRKRTKTTESNTNAPLTYEQSYHDFGVCEYLYSSHRGRPSYVTNQYSSPPQLLVPPSALPQRQSPLRGYTVPEAACMEGCYPTGTEPAPNPTVIRDFKTEPELGMAKPPSCSQVPDADSVYCRLPGQEKLICDLDALPKSGGYYSSCK